MTAVASVPPTQPRSRSIYLYIGLGLFITLLAAGIVIGLKDSGAINVEAVIAERKANASPEERAVIERAQQSVNLTQVPDGGLVPSTDQTMPPPEPVATTTATTSAESAAATATTSTEAAPATTSEDILVPSETIE